MIRAAAFFSSTMVTVPAGGGTCTEARAGNGGAVNDTLVVLPGSEAMLFARAGANTGIYALPATGAAKLVIAGDHSPRYLAANRHLLYFRSGVRWQSEKGPKCQRGSSKRIDGESAAPSCIPSRRAIAAPEVFEPPRIEVDPVLMNFFDELRRRVPTGK